MALSSMYSLAGQDREDSVNREEIALVCVPVLAADTVKRRKKKELNLDIETRRPASWVDLPSWHEDEPDSSMRLPTPQQRVKADQVTAEVVPVNVSGANFQRMAEF